MHKIAHRTFDVSANPWKMRFHPRSPTPKFPSSDEQRRNWVLVSPSAFELFMKGVEGKVQRDLSSFLAMLPHIQMAFFVFQGGFSALNQKTNKLFFHILSEASFFFSLPNLEKPCCDGFFLWLPRYGQKVYKYSKKSRNESLTTLLLPKASHCSRS